MSTHRSKFLGIAGAALMAGLLALSSCSSTDGGENPTTPAPPTTELPVTTPEPASTPSASSTPTSPAPTETTGASSPTPTETSEGPTAALPANAVDYADALIIAWGAGDRDRMKQLAEPAVVDVLDEYGTTGGPHWDQLGHDAGAGSVFVNYQNTVDGTNLELRVQNEAASKAQEHAVAEAKFDG